MTDSINPDYYRSQKIQIIEMIRDMPFSLGNAVKYIYRCRNKNNKLEDLKKALWYVKDHSENSSEIRIDNNSDFIGVSDETISVLFAESDDFERQAIKNIYDNFLINGDYTGALNTIQEEIDSMRL